MEVTTTWPLVEAAPRRVEARLPPGCAPLSPLAPIAPLASDPAEDRAVEHARYRCAGVALAGAEIEIDGLTVGVPEVVVHARLRDRPPLTVVARRDRPSVILGRADAPAAAVSFVDLGVRHILSGLDHLLFVFGLLLLVLRASDFAERGLRAVPWRRLLGAVTAFTCAHSITLALAGTGVVALPPRGVEAAIALSIVALAAELARTPATRSTRRPWLLAFGFGLLHGFGFAGALVEIGLPRASLLSSLLRFNVGVELGQLAFVGAALALLAAIRWLASARVQRVERVTVYAMGTLATYWFFGRTLTLLQ
ncbi:MAG TPA: HupE/UreJ family protein [Polyangia bacterium]|nr:HupE/UreJ family protein [Polyangia bacterium]